MRKKILSVIICLALVVSIIPTVKVQAALTQTQIQAVLGLLQAFGADDATITSVSNALYGTTTTTPVTTPVQTPACTDTDNGIDYLTKGTATSKIGSYTDFCSATAANVVVEFYCQGAIINFSRHVCPNGCSNGICISSTSSTHNVCNTSQQCISIQGAGANTCVADNDCAATSSTHNVCNTSQQCVSVQGAGANTCVANADCTTSAQPSITSVTSPTPSNNKMIVYGANLSSLQSLGQVYIDSVLFNTGIDGTKDGSSLFFVPPTFSTGQHTIYVKTDAGTSNIFMFTISSTTQPSITVTSPNGGENWKIGETHRITWTSSGVTTVRIYIYTSDLGFSSGSTNYVNDWANNGPTDFPASQGYYDWTINAQALPGGSSVPHQYKIRIDDIDNGSGNVTVSDWSNNYFTVSPAGISTHNACNASQQCVSVQGAGVNTCVANTDCTTSAQPSLTFTASPTSVSSGGYTLLSWSSTNATSCTSSGDGASWGWPSARYTSGAQYTTGLTSSQTYTMTCTGAGGSVSKSVTVTVSGTTTITPTITVNTPRSGEALTSGQTYMILWNSTGMTSSENVTLTTMLCGLNNTGCGAGGVTTIATVPNSGYYAWTVPAVTQAWDSYINIAGSHTSGQSATFRINPQQSITVTSPSAGANISAGSTINISWSAANVDSSYKVHIDLIQLMGQNNFQTQIASNIAVNTGAAYSVSIPSNMASGQYKIAVIACGGTGQCLGSDPSIVAYSGIFNIAALTAQPAITSISPTSGPVGTTVTVYGSGFNSSQRVYFTDALGGGSNPTSSNTTANVSPSSVSTDGKMMTFVVPNLSYTGNYTIAASPNGGPASNWKPFTVTQASGTLTQSQIQSIISLAQSFGANASAISNLQLALTGGAPSAPTSGSGLTQQQIAAIVSLSQSFGASSTIISNVQFALTGQPAINSISPTSGPVGTVVTINGSNLDSATMVYFPTSGVNGYQIQLTSVTSSQIVFSIPTSVAPGRYSLNLFVGGNNVIAGPDFTVTSTAGTLATPNLNIASTTASQYIAAAGGATNATQAMYNFVSAGGTSTITKLNFAVSGSNTVSNVCVGSVCSQPDSGGVARLSGLQLTVPNGGAGLSQSVSVSYGAVGAGGITPGITSSIALAYVEYLSGGVTQTLTTNVPAPAVTLVGSMPIMTVNSGPGMNSIATQIGRATITANTKGGIKIRQIAFNVAFSGFTSTPSVANLKIDADGTDITGSSCSMSGNVITCTLGSGYASDYPISSGTKNFNLTGKVNGALSSSLGYVSTVLSPSGFIWDDMSSNGTAGTGLTGSLIYNFPTNTYNTASDQFTPASALDAFIQALQSMIAK